MSRGHSRSSVATPSFNACHAEYVENASAGVTNVSAMSRATLHTRKARDIRVRLCTTLNANGSTSDEVIRAISSPSRKKRPKYNHDIRHSVLAAGTSLRLTCAYHHRSAPTNPV